MKPKVIYVIGVFDLFHRGHVELLRRAREMGDRLVVAINGDDMVASYKRRPYFSEEDRLEIVRACRFVDEAFVIREYDNKSYLLQHQVTHIVHGDDWGHESYLEQIRVNEDFLDSHGISMVFVPYWDGVSTSGILNAIRSAA